MLAIIIHFGMKLHYYNVANFFFFFSSLQHEDLLNYFTGR